MNEVDPLKLRQLRGAIRSLGQAFGKPILFKNMNCALRLRPTCSALPEAVFIVIRRNLIHNALSLLRVRQRVQGDYGTWWSMEPPDIEKLRLLPPHAQVVEQVNNIYALIRDDMKEIGKGRFVWVEYEALCDDVPAVLGRLNEFLVSHGIQVSHRATRVPSQFDRCFSPQVPAGLAQQVIDYCSNV